MVLVVHNTGMLSCRSREDLPSKCFTKHRRRSPGPTSLNSRQWRFVRTRLDDFRKGRPPRGGGITQGPEEGFLPQIYHRAPRPAPSRRQKNMLPREAAPCSTLSPARQARNDFRADVEAQPTPHPSALYADLEEDMPAEVTTWRISLLRGLGSSLQGVRVMNVSPGGAFSWGLEPPSKKRKWRQRTRCSVCFLRGHPTYKGPANQKCLASLPLKLYQSTLLVTF